MIFALLLATAAPPQRIVHIEVDGEAEIVTGNVREAEQQARWAAEQKLRDAVIAALPRPTAIIGGFRYIGVPFDDVHEQFGPITNGFADRTRKVTLRADVDMQRIERAICDRVHYNDDPHVTLVSAYPRATPMLERGFQQACFTVVYGDPATSMAKVVHGASRYVVVAKGTPGVMSVELIDKNLETVVLKAEKKLTIGGANDTEYDEQIVAPLVEQLLKQVVSDWDALVERADSGGARVQLRVDDVDAVAPVQALIDKVLAAKSEKRSFEKRRAIFDVTVGGGAEKAAEALEGKKIGERTIEIMEVTRGRVIARLAGAVQLDEAAIQEVVVHYAQAFARGYDSWVEDAVHPDVSQHALSGDALTRKNSLELMRSAHETRTLRDKEPKIDVVILDQRGDVAAVKLTRGATLEYLHLAKIAGKWKIVDVLASAR